jgi:hypothetical protein
MKLVLVSPTFLSLFPCIAQVLATQVALPERSSPSFAGSDNYFLHGVSSSEQARYISTLNTWGAKVLRLWGTPPTGRFIRACLLHELTIYSHWSPR